MLQRLFRNKAVSRDTDDSHSQMLVETQPWQPAQLQQDHLRVLFCQDVGDSNKTILYDSDYFLNNNDAGSALARSWNGSQYQSSSRHGGMELGSFKDQRHDWRPSYMRTMPSLTLSDQQRHTRPNHRKLDLTGEMIFGTAPLAYKGMNTKVHYYKKDKNPQIIISKVFTLNNHQSPSSLYASDSMRRTSFSSINSDRSTASFLANSSLCEDNASEQSSDDDHYSHSYYQPAFASTKRTRKFAQTNMENGLFNPTPLPTSRLSAVENPVRQTSRSVKFAVAIVITLEDKNETLYDFVFSHFALIENRLHQFQAVAFKQLYQYFKHHPSPHLQPRKRSSTIFLGPNAFQNDTFLIEASSQFEKSFFDLYLTPRIQEPLWLNMSTFPQKKPEYDASLIKELMRLIQQFDNKAHNYFISTLLTGVLMHHLSWVHTVAPPEANQHIGCHHGNYDPLWAQLSDLYGFVGTPSRITRTVVAGLKPSVVRRILYILSYFIRCNEVYENSECRSKSKADVLSSSVSSESIFSRELDDVNSEHRFEDKIARHLTGDVESIAIPQNASSTAASGTSISRDLYAASSSIDSTNSLKSSSRWLSDTDERPWSPDPFVVVSSSPSSLSLELPPTFVSPNECYHVSMPKSTITRMEPDITQQQEQQQQGASPTEDDIPHSKSTSTCASSSSTTRIDRLYAKSYGRSLMASYCDAYKSDFVLMGIPTLPPTSVLDSDLHSTLEQFTLSDSIFEASCLTIDTNNFKCRVLTHKTSDTLLDTPPNTPAPIKKPNPSGNWQTIEMSNFVHEMLATMKQKYDDDNGDSSCSEEIITYLEDSLQLIYLYSVLLQDLIQGAAAQDALSPANDLAGLASKLKLKQNDIPLLLNVCSTYDSKIWEMQKNTHT
ncbi:hypothetical protein [Parasitella parasitica]|uniref:UDENN FNIP1/2-type domain-containing protein n=1 Tax=Parasitella parasitica TaxID=35722 RepID=A0A0B7MU53_9FUNG|nr:hypothetical protein [Parasitella parasitica]